MPKEKKSAMIKRYRGKKNKRKGKERMDNGITTEYIETLMISPDRQMGVYLVNQRGRKSVLKIRFDSKISKQKTFEEYNMMQQFKTCEYIMYTTGIVYVDHPGVDEGVYALSMPYAEGNTLLDFLKGKPRNAISEKQFVYYALQMCKALLTSHNWSVCHRDISLENWLFMDSKHSHLVLSDWEFAIDMSKYNSTDGKLYKQCGKHQYASPQLLSKDGYSGFKTDIWSLGVCYFSMLTGNPLHNERTSPRILEETKGNSVKKRLFQVTKDTDLIHLISTMLHPLEARRPSTWYIMQKLCEIKLKLARQAKMIHFLE
jgi:serine/threonine protein kinase